jgi:polysaccharide biosynthesis PFTS motif protein
MKNFSDQKFHNRSLERLNTLKTNAKINFKNINTEELARDYTQKLHKKNLKLFLDDDYTEEKLERESKLFSTYQYLKYSLGISFLIFKNLFNKKINSNYCSFSIFLDFNLNIQIPYKDYQSKFAEYLNDSTLYEDIKNSNLLIKNHEEHTNIEESHNIYYKKKFIFTEITKFLSISKSLGILASFTMTIPANLLRILFSNNLYILNRDIATYELIKILNNQSLLKNIIISNSNIYNQPFWMNDIGDRKDFKSHMLFYSLNSKRFMHQDDDCTQHQEVSYLSLINTDLAHTWNVDEKEWILAYTQIKKILFEKPILLYKNIVKKVEHKQETVCIFDIPAFQDHIITPFVSKNKNFYYTVENVCTYIKNSTELALSENYKVKLKIKRGLSDKKHHPEYLSLINSLKDKVEIIDEAKDTYDLLKDCDYSISIPMTSTYYVSRHLDIKSCFYDPTGSLLPPIGVNKSNLCLNKDELSLFLKS